MKEEEVTGDRGKRKKLQEAGEIEGNYRRQVKEEDMTQDRGNRRK